MNQVTMPAPPPIATMRNPPSHALRPVKRLSAAPTPNSAMPAITAATVTARPSGRPRENGSSGRIAPAASDLDVSGLDVEEADVAEALRVNPDEWRAELPQIEEWFDFIGEKLPTGVKDEFDALKQRLAEAD